MVSKPASSGLSAWIYVQSEDKAKKKSLGSLIKDTTQHGKEKEITTLFSKPRNKLT
jgi:hypothetical protein